VTAECTNGTLVLLTGKPHEMQNVSQDSLPLTPRPPIEGEPNACKQEATDGVVTAERTKGTVETAEPTETDADVDRTALLGGEPAERACGVDEGDEERERKSRLQQTIFYCKESRQRDENAKNDVPHVHGLPLEGEWLVYASGETTNSNGDADASNAAVERVYGPSESRETEDAMENESRGCGEGTSGRASVDEADGSAGRELKRVDAQNELTQLLTTTITSYVDDGDMNARVHLKCMSWCAGDANGVGDRTDGSRGRADESKGWTDTLDVSNGTGIAGMSDGKGAETYLGVRDAKRVVNVTDGVGIHTDASNGQADLPNVQTNANKPANTPEIVSIPRKRTKPPDLPFGTTRTAPDEPNGCGSHADGSSARTHAYCVGNDMQTAANEAESVRMRRMGSKTQNSPVAHGIVTAKRPRRWRMVSVEEVHVYVAWNASIETASRNFVFGQVESGDEAIAPNVEGERAGNGDGNGDGDNGDVGDVDGTTSGGDSDSIRVEAALLAGESQRVRYSRRTRTGNLPVSSRPPIQPARRPYGLVRR